MSTLGFFLNLLRLVGGSSPSPVALPESFASPEAASSSSSSSIANESVAFAIFLRFLVFLASSLKPFSSTYKPSILRNDCKGSDNDDEKHT